MFLSNLFYNKFLYAILIQPSYSKKTGTSFLRYQLLYSFDFPNDHKVYHHPSWIERTWYFCIRHERQERKRWSASYKWIFHHTLARYWEVHILCTEEEICNVWYYGDRTKAILSLAISLSLIQSRFTARLSPDRYSTRISTIKYCPWVVHQRPSLVQLSSSAIIINHLSIWL